MDEDWKTLRSAVRLLAHGEIYVEGLAALARLEAERDALREREREAEAVWARTLETEAALRAEVETRRKQLAAIFRAYAGGRGGIGEVTEAIAAAIDALGDK